MYKHVFALVYKWFVSLRLRVTRALYLVSDDVYCTWAKVWEYTVYRHTAINTIMTVYEYKSVKGFEYLIS